MVKYSKPASASSHVSLSVFAVFYVVVVGFKVKAVKKGNSIRMTIPKEITEYLKINPEDALE